MLIPSGVSTGCFGWPMMKLYFHWSESEYLSALYLGVGCLQVLSYFCSASQSSTAYLGALVFSETSKISEYF